MTTAFIGIGSNLADREKNIAKAIQFLKEADGIEVRKVSSIIETKPESPLPQGPYLNGVIKITTTLSARQLLSVLQKIEIQLGRKRSLRWGPRTIDLDILLYGNKRIHEPDLIVPHPRMFSRRFVLEPLREIEPFLSLEELCDAPNRTAE